MTPFLALYYEQHTALNFFYFALCPFGWNKEKEKGNRADAGAGRNICAGWGLWACPDWRKGVKGDLIAPCSFLRRRSREGDVGLFFLWYGKWEQMKVGPGRFRSGDFSSPRWWSNTGAAFPEKWSKCQTCQCLRAFGLYILTFGQHWIGQTVGLDDHCRFLMTEIIYFILKSLQVNPDQHVSWD